jgi:hypothetical protein
MLPNEPVLTPGTPAPKPVKEPKNPAVKKEKPPKPPKPPEFVFGQDIKEQSVLSEIRSLSSNMELNNLTIGWKCAEYYGLVKQDSISAFGSERKALSETITFLSEDSGQKRATVADLLRVCLIVNKDTYDAIVVECAKTQPPEWRGPSFWQLRSCVVTEQGTASQQETNDRINWAVSQSWPSAREIRANFAPAGQPKLSPADRAWNIMVKAAQRVVELTGPENPKNKVAQEVMKIWAGQIKA